MSPSTELPPCRRVVLLNPPSECPPPRGCPPPQRGYPLSRGVSPPQGGAPSAGGGGLNFIKIRKIRVTALRPEKKPLVGANFQKIFLTCLSLSLAKLTMPFLVTPVAKAYKIFHIKPTIRGFRDRDDVMDFGSRFNDVLFIAILTQRMIVSVSFR